MPNRQPTGAIVDRLRNNSSQDWRWVVPWALFNDAEEHSSREIIEAAADAIESKRERSCNWVWGEEWLESSPASPCELQWANWYLDCGCWEGDEDDFEDLDNPDEVPKGHWMYCPRCGAKVVFE